MTDLASHRIKIHYDGGIADHNQLPLYDGTTSIQGFAQALSIATHAYTKNEIVSRATALRGARLLLAPSRRGSFIIEAIAVIEAYPAVSGVAAAISAPVFYDFIKYSIGKAVGLLNIEPETNHVRKLVRKDEPFFDELGETLEGSLQRAHRPLGGQVREIYIERPRGRLITLDNDTKDWVETRDEALQVTRYRGNVTRYNSISRNGRIYIEELERVVPFRPDGDFSSGDLGRFTWSLHGSNTAVHSRLLIDAKPVRSASGKIKRLLVSGAARAPFE